MFPAQYKVMTQYEVQTSRENYTIVAIHNTLYRQSDITLIPEEFQCHSIMNLLLFPLLYKNTQQQDFRIQDFICIPISYCNAENISCSWGLNTTNNKEEINRQNKRYNSKKKNRQFSWGPHTNTNKKSTYKTTVIKTNKPKKYTKRSSAVYNRKYMFHHFLTH